MDPISSRIRSVSVLPVASSAASQGFYYTLACAQTGLFTDPSTGACSDPSNPASLNCAYGSGESCVGCPVGTLCPGGRRLWPRAGFWVSSESATEVIACPPPDAETRCQGWSVVRGASECGTGYLTGSYLCGACAPAYFPSDEGKCEACPVVTGAWEKYRGIVLLVGSLASLVAVIGGILYAQVRYIGGSFNGGAKQLAALGVWGMTTLQAFSQASQVSSAALPPILAALYRGVAVLQLQGIVMHPSCTGAYPFQTQVGIMVSALASWGVAACIYASRTRVGFVRTIGRLALTLAVILFTVTWSNVVDLLNCGPATMTALALGSLDGGVSAGGVTEASRIGSSRANSNMPYTVGFKVEPILRVLGIRR